MLNVKPAAHCGGLQCFYGDENNDAGGGHLPSARNARCN